MKNWKELASMNLSMEVKTMSEKLLTLRCPNCGEAVEIKISKVTKQPPSIEDVKAALDEWIDQVDIAESGDSIIVTPKGYLGKEPWYQINNVLKTFDAEWVSAGKESKWIIKH